ncbi:MAG: hypothetical protein ABIZ04_21435 [Opitutus sp.]
MARLAPFYPDWTKTTKEDASIQLSAVTGDPGKLWPYPKSALPAGIANGMPEIDEVFVSGYANAKSLPGGITAIGELLVTRPHDVPESGKAYMWLVGVSKEKDVYLRGPYKPYGPHYYNVDQGVPLNELFGRIDHTNLNKTSL